jgi:hypothetical protein
MMTGGDARDAREETRWMRERRLMKRETSEADSGRDLQTVNLLSQAAGAVVMTRCMKARDEKRRSIQTETLKEASKRDRQAAHAAIQTTGRSNRQR